ncbi:MAG: oligosaccharide flippase family protein [Colwellia sp.]
MKKALIKSSAFRVLEISIITTVSLLLTPYLISNLGEESYGLWLLILSVLGWFNFIDLGFSYTVQRNIVIALEKAEHHRINIIFSVAVVLFSCLGLLAASCILLIAFFPEVLGVNSSNLYTAKIALTVLAVKVLLDFIMNSFHGFYTAYLRTDIDAILSTLNMLLKSILVFILIIDLNVYGAVIATIFADIVTHILKIYYAKKLHPDFKFILHLVKFHEVKELFSYSKHLILIGVANSVNRRVDPIVISHVLGLKYVALYNLINSLIYQVESLVRAIVTVLQPVLTKVVAKGNNINEPFKQISSINFFTVILFYTPLSILAQDFIHLWIGAEFSHVGQLAPILGFAYICRAVARPIRDLLLAKAQHQLLSVVNISGAIVNIVLSLALGKLYGLKGIAIATACGFFISDVVLHIILLKKFTAFSVMQPLFQFFKLTILFILLSNVGLFIMDKIDPLTWGGLAIAAPTCFIITLLIVWPLVLNSVVKNKLVKTLLKKGTSNG